MTVTRQDVRESLEAQNPRCRGPRRPNLKVVWLPLARSRPDLDDVAVKVARAAGHSVEDADAAIDKLKTTGADSDETIRALLQEETEESLRAARLVDEWVRDPCGQSLIELELAEPLDGLVHKATCPGCGRTVEWRPPYVEGDEGP